MIPHRINKSAVQISAEVISNKKFGPYHHMVFAVGEMAANSRPGNFVAISIVLSELNESKIIISLWEKEYQILTMA